MKLKLTILHLLVVCACLYLGSTEEYKRVCYYSNWSQYRNGAGKFYPEDIQADLCTHLIYSFAKLDNNYELITYEWNDVQLYQRFNALKVGTNIKTLLAIGGWNAGSEPFSIMVTDPFLREKFAYKAVDFIIQHDFDGLDMDWEYPANRGGAASDKENFIKLLEDIKVAMKAANHEHLLLTAAVSAGSSTSDKAYDIPGMVRNLDFINLMSYDLHGGWEDFTGHQSPLYSRASESPEQRELNVDWAADYWVRKGCPREKLIIGLATYGRHFRLLDPNYTEMGAPTIGAGTAGPYTREAGFLAYYEICTMLDKGGDYYWHDEHQIPYLVLGDQWVGYDDERSFTNKLYIKDNGFGGAMIWNVDLDDFNQLCGGRRYPLMSLMREVLGDYVGTTPSVTNKPPTTAAPTDAPKTETPIVTDKPTTNSPTDGPSGGDFTCVGKSDGIYGDTYDCSAYHYCTHGAMTTHYCAGDLLWNSERKYCDYKRNVKCVPVNTPEPTTVAPTQAPTQAPTTAAPTKAPTTAAPTEAPTTAAPTQPPTQAPTTAVPTDAPTDAPTDDDNFCVNQPAGLYRKKGDCQEYYSCAHGLTTVYICPPGTLFDAGATICNWASLVDCTDSNASFCAGKTDGLYRKIDDCQAYYHCSHGLTYTKRCSDGTLFDVKGYCNWPSLVDCTQT